jgi:ABC-type transport system involved in multi-copper enzyme maturation permease subunit
MWRAFRSEIIRLKRPSVLLIGIGLMAVFGALATFVSFSAAGTTGTGPAAYFPPVEALEQPGGFALGLVLGSQLIGIVALSVWAIAVASDYSTGMIRLLVQAEPKRWRLLMGKFGALLVITVIGTAVATLAATGMAYAIAPSFEISTAEWNTDMATTLWEAFRNLTFSTIVWGVFGSTIATITRSSGISIGAGIGYLVVFETMLQGIASDAAEWLPGGILTALNAGGTPNVEFAQAAALAAAYALIGIVISVAISWRREIVY